MATFSFTQNNNDYIRPGAGFENWNNDSRRANIPNPAVYVEPLDFYYRFSYTDIAPYNSPAGTYDFGNSHSSDMSFDAAINQAIDRGQKFSFAIMTVCSYCGGHGGQVFDPASGRTSYLFYPLYLHNQMQGENPKDWTSASDGSWWPNWNSNFWLTAWENLHVAINNHLMTGSHVQAGTGKTVFYRDVINNIDISGYGVTGEWTGLQFHGGGTDATSASLIRIFDAVVNAYPNFQIVTQMAAYDGMQLSNTLIPKDVSYHAIIASNARGKVGWRREDWGWTDAYNDGWTIENNVTYTPPGGTQIVFKNLIREIWKTGPVVGEPADLGNSGNGSVAFAAMPQQMIDHHVMSFGNGNLDNNEFNTTALNNYRASAKLAGGRLWPQAGNITGNTVSLTWNNNGNAPYYDDWDVYFDFKQAGVSKFKVMSTFKPRLFLPGTTTVNDTVSITGGVYDLFLIVQDPKAYRKPMPLALSSPSQQTDGSYLLASGVTVPGSSPVANAGTDQTITLPTNSTTLNGSASIGATSYLWTRISGPNTPTIVSPTNVTTSVTGLIQGVYQFQLSINGGASTDIVQVTVNNAPVTTTSTTTSTSTTTTTTPTPPTGEVNIFTTQTPASGIVAETDSDDGTNPFTGEEVGVRFRSAINGYITGIRFYKLAGQLGTRTGELYSNTGTRLATVFFDNETGSGWQRKTFSVPVPITANTTYVAAYWSSLGWYVEQNFYWQGVSVTNYPLTALADGIDGINGPYKYTAAPAFPQTAFASANYWVDVLFQAQLPTTTTTSTSTTTTTTLPTTTTTTSTTSSTTTTTTTSSTTTTTTSTTTTSTSTTTTTSHGSTTSTSTSSTTTLFPPPSTTTTTTTSTSSTTSTTTSTTSTTSSTTTSTTTTSTTTSTTSTTTTSTSSTTSTTSTSTTSTTTPQPPNIPPVSNAGADKTITLPTTTATLNGSSSYDPDGFIVSYVWSQISGPNFASLQQSSSVVASASNLVVGSYVFQLRVTDDRGGVGLSSININVIPASDIVPVAIVLGYTMGNTAAGTVTFDGTRSIGSNLSYNWTQVTGPTALIVNPKGAVTQAILPLIGAYTFVLTVVDPLGRTSRTQLPVNISVNFNTTSINFTNPL